MVALENHPGLNWEEIRDMIFQYLEKIVLQLAGYQSKISCGKLQICSRLEYGREGANRAVWKRREEKEEAKKDGEEGGYGGMEGIRRSGDGSGGHGRGWE